jgi:methyl-accepting chemotaxis protein/methyl-accepting chemotaxis protein-1 (serine sensor receptor)
MKQLSIRSKLMLSIGLLATGYLLFLGLVQWTAATTGRHLTTVSKSIYPAALSIEHAQAGFEKLNKDYKDSVLLQDKGALDRADESAQQVSAALGDVRDKVAFDAALQAQATTALASFESFAARSKTLYGQMVEHPDSPGADNQASLAALTHDSREIASSLSELNDEVGNKAFTAELSAVDSSNARQKMLALALFLVAASFSAIAVMTMERQVSAPLRELAQRLGDGARQVASSAQEVSVSGQSLANGASSQAASLEETSASSQEISSMAQRSADDCRSTAELVTMSQRKFEETNLSLNGLLIAMDEINASSGKVSKIIKVIDEIAFQTNILALNAAVEAARAGEAGKGFAVVADEVRNLAQRCAKAAQDSAEIIAESIDRSQLGKRKLDDVASSILSVTSESVKVKVFVDQINAASTEQTRGIQQIAQSISAMEKVTQQSAATAQESAAAAQELTVQSDLMNQIVTSLSLVVEGA